MTISAGRAVNPEHMVILKSWVFYHQQNLYRSDKVFKVNVLTKIEWGKKNHIKGYDVKINTDGSKMSYGLGLGTFLDDYDFVFQMNGSHFIRKYIKFVGHSYYLITELFMAKH